MKLQLCVTTLIKIVLVCTFQTLKDIFERLYLFEVSYLLVMNEILDSLISQKFCFSHQIKTVIFTPFLRYFSAYRLPGFWMKKAI